jgi:Na+/H+-dicarboxylate symporter
VKFSLTAQCVIGLGAGIAGGTALSLAFSAGVPTDWVGPADTAIRLWTNALRLVVSPLIVAQLFVAIAAQRGVRGEATRLGLLIPAVFIGLFALVAAFSTLVGGALLALPPLAGLSLPAGTLPAPAGASSANPGAAVSWLDGLVPSNLFAAASSDFILALMLFTLAFAIAARRLPDELRVPLERGARAVRDTMFVLVEWLVRIAPLALFALGYRFATRSGLEVGGVLLAFVGFAGLVLLLSILLLYPVATLAGAPLGRFARAAFPAQAAAAASRSSIATVPLLLRDADRTLGLPARITSLVVPAGGATLKISQAGTPVLRLLFLAHLIGLTLTPGAIVTFVAGVFLLSPSVPGVPRIMSGTTSLPLYLAAGIPAEHVLLLGPSTALLDILLTVLNTTSYLAAATVVSRLLGFLPARLRPAVAEPAPLEAPVHPSSAQSPG